MSENELPLPCNLRPPFKLEIDFVCKACAPAVNQGPFPPLKHFWIQQATRGLTNQNKFFLSNPRIFTGRHSEWPIYTTAKKHSVQISKAKQGPFSTHPLGTNLRSRSQQKAIGKHKPLKLEHSPKSREYNVKMGLKCNK